LVLGVLRLRVAGSLPMGIIFNEYIIIRVADAPPIITISPNTVK